jgi:hypothetical protein
MVITSVDGGFTTWSQWTICDGDCGGTGSRSRSRSCTNPAPDCGGADCSGPDEETVTCTVGDGTGNPGTCSFRAHFNTVHFSSEDHCSDILT